MKYVPLAPTSDMCGADHEWVREDKRKRMAQKIRDELGQQLLGLRMDIVMLRERITEVHPQLDDAVADVLRQLDTTMCSVRAVIRGLRPAVRDFGLRAAIEWQCAEWTRRGGIACDLVWGAGEIAMNDRCATALFRTLQESLTNVHRHAQASRIRIDMNSNGHFVMTVSDNGIGIMPSDYAKMHANGLSGMRERITTLSGEFAIHSTTREGMTYGIAADINADRHAVCLENSLVLCTTDQ